MTIDGNIDLMQISGAKVGTSKGESVLLIPIENAPNISVFTGKDGALHAYLNISVHEKKEIDQYGYSHFAKLGTTKKFSDENHTKEEFYAVTPIVGNLKVRVQTDNYSSSSSYKKDAQEVDFQESVTVPGVSNDKYITPENIKGLPPEFASASQPQSAAQEGGVTDDLPF